jgi:hypothetical protein
LFNNSGSTGGSANLTFNLSQNLFAVGTNTVFANVTSGLVGIGTSSPSNKLEVNGAVAFNGIGFNTNAINTTSTSARIIRLTSTGGDFYVGTESSTGGAVFPGSTAYAAVLYNSAVTPMQFWTGGTLRMTLDTSGNLGIGTSGPVAKLDVVGGNGDGIQYRTSTRSIGIGQISSQASLFWGSSTDLTFFAGSELARLTSAGNLGIGTSSPSALLTILGPIGSVNDSAGTMRLATTYSTSGSANALGAGIVFAQRYFNSEATAIRVGGIYGIKTEANGNFGGGLAFYSQPGSSADMSERMRLDHLGNLGIGTSNPAGYGKFTVFGTGYIGHFNSTSGSVGIGFYENGTGRFYIKTLNGSDGLAFIDGDSTTERMRIDTNGDVALGSSSVSRVGSDTTFYIQGTAFASLNLGCGGAYAGAGLTVNSEAALLFRNTGAERARITSAGHFRPAADNTYNLGEAAFRWANIYTADLNLSNRDSQNDVDGTWGEWTIQEGENDLYLINRRNGKKFKFMLKEVE